MQTTRRCERHSERGAALIFVLISLMVLTMIGIGFTFQSLTDYRISENFVSRQEALAIAEAGMAITRQQIQRGDFSALLAQQGTVPAYIAGDVPAAGSLASRNPISTRAARNVNFSAPPTPAAYYQVNGLLTPPTGQSYFQGRYFAKISNNNFGAPGTLFGLDTSSTVDTDFRVLVRVTGIRPTAGEESVDGRSNLKSSVAVVEAMFKRNTTLLLQSPLVINAPVVTQNFNGNSFFIDGFSHNGMTRAEITSNHTENGGGAAPGIATVHDSIATGDGLPAAETLYAALGGNKSNNVIGATGIHNDNQPSVNDITNTLRTSTDPDQAKLLNPNFVGNLVGKVRNFADNYYSSSQSFSGSGVSLGTVASPKITYVNGDLSMTGGGSGAGLLVVKGALELGGSFAWDGLIFVVGEGKLRIHGANLGIIGGVYVQNLTETTPGQFVSGPADIEFSGNSNFYYSSDMIRMGLGLLPLQMLEWREISSDAP
ncbi:MAG: pilus assembly PilX family protein [Acidobacteriota bacterium]